MARPPKKVLELPTTSNASSNDYFIVEKVGATGNSTTSKIKKTDLFSDVPSEELLTSSEGASSVGYKLDATGSVDRRVNDRIVETIYASDFGVVGDGTTDNSEALSHAIKYAASKNEVFTGYRMGTAEIVLPEGVIRITESGILSDLGKVKRGGFKLRGQGQENTILWLDPDGTETDKWFYDNQATQRTWGTVFEDICFCGGTNWPSGNPTTDAGVGYSNINPNVKGFKFTGPGWESAQMFVRCKFSFLELVLHCEGSNNADQIRFDTCEYSKCHHLFYINNPQSLGISDIGGYASALYGDYLTYGPNALGGGGNFSKIAGSIIMLADDADNDGYLVRMEDGGPSTASAPILFTGVRVEARGTRAKIAIVSYATPAMIKFDSCSFLNTGASNKEVVDLGGYAQLKFDNCTFANQAAGKMQFKIRSSSRYGKNPHLAFIGSMVPIDIHDHILWEGGSGRITIDELCSTTTTGAYTNATAIACDRLGPDLNYFNSVSNRTKQRFTAPLAIANTIVNTTEYVLTIPPYSEIVEVWARIDANSSATTSNVQLHIGNDDKSVIYATSNTGQFKDGVFAYSSGIFKNVGTSSNDRNIRLWFTNGDGSAASSSINSAGAKLRSGVVWE